MYACVCSLSLHMYICISPVKQNQQDVCMCVCVYIWDFPGGSSGKELTCQCRRCRFDPWVRKYPWRRK